VATPETTFDIRREDLSYKAIFAEPQFALLFAAARSFQFLHARLAPLGLRLADIKVEGTAANPGEFTIVCSLPLRNAALRIRLENIELTAVSPAPAGVLREVAATGIEAVREIAGSNFRRVAVHQVIWEAHGTLELPVLDFLKRYVPVSPWEGRATGGVSFSIGGDSAGRVAGHAVLAPSVLLEGGLYLQINANFDGALSVDSVREGFSSLVQEVGQRLGIAPKDGGF